MQFCNALAGIAPIYKQCRREGDYRENGYDFCSILFILAIITFSRAICHAVVLTVS